MAWYDIERWEGVLQEHSATNTTRGFLRALTRFSASRTGAEISRIASEDIQLVDDIPYTQRELRVIIWVCTLREMIKNPHYSSYTVWKHISLLLSQLRYTSRYFEHVRFTQREIQEYLSTNLPNWYAKGLKDGRIPIRESREYRFTNFNTDTDVFQLLRGLGLYNEFEVSISMPFEDADEYRSLIRDIFKNSQKTPEDVSSYLTRVCNENASHLRMEEWLLFAHISGYDSFTKFVIHSGVKVGTVAISALSLDDLLEIIRNAYEEYYHDNQKTVDEPRQDRITRLSRPFYSPLDIVSGISRRPDITFEFYITRLITLPWWNLPVPNPYNVHHRIQIPRQLYNEYPHGAVNTRFLSGILETDYEHVFREFMEHKDVFRDTIHPYVEQEGNTHRWKIFCHSISGCKFLTIDDVLDLSEIDWDWEMLSRNPSVATPETILTHPDLPWEWGCWGISASPSLTSEFILQNWENGLSFGNPVTSRDDVSGTLSGNHSVVTPELIDTLSDKPWSYAFYGLSSNDMITLPWFIKNIQKPWNPVGIVSRLKPDRDLAARAIQSWWRILIVRRRCARLASDVEEWWYSPDCKPASRIRSSIWEQHVRGAFEMDVGV